MSLLPPGGNGTMSRIGLSGYSAAPSAVGAALARASAAVARVTLNFMRFPLRFEAVGRGHRAIVTPSTGETARAASSRHYAAQNALLGETEIGEQRAQGRILLLEEGTGFAAAEIE